MPSLELTLMAGCPLLCKFCPQDKLKAAYGKAEKYLSLENFGTILAKIPKHVRIDFSGMAEPWANPDCTQMLRETLEAGYNIAIYTTLYEMKDAETVAALLEKHRDQCEVLCLHLPDAQGNMRGWRYSMEYEAALIRFLDLRRVLPRFECMTMHKGGTVHPDLAHLGIYLQGWLGHTRAGTLDAPEGQLVEAAPNHTGPVMCSFTPFYDQLVLLPNGDVTLCCMAYKLEPILGNLLRQDYYSIFSGPAMGALRAENMKIGGRSLCHTCNRAVALGTGPANRLMWGMVE